jgi:hypothetical protein
MRVLVKIATIFSVLSCSTIWKKQNAGTDPETTANQQILDEEKGDKKQTADADKEKGESKPTGDSQETEEQRWMRESNLEKNSALVTSLKTLFAVDDLMACLQKLKEVKYLDLSVKKLHHIGLMKFAEKLTYLDVSNNKIKDINELRQTGVKHVQSNQMFEECDQLDFLSVSCGQLQRLKFQKSKKGTLPLTNYRSIPFPNVDIDSRKVQNYFDLDPNRRFRLVGTILAQDGFLGRGSTGAIFSIYDKKLDTIQAAKVSSYNYSSIEQSTEAPTIVDSSDATIELISEIKYPLTMYGDIEIKPLIVGYTLADIVFYNLMFLNTETSRKMKDAMIKLIDNLVKKKVLYRDASMGNIMYDYSLEKFVIVDGAEITLLSEKSECEVLSQWWSKHFVGWGWQGHFKIDLRDLSAKNMIDFLEQTSIDLAYCSDSSTFKKHAKAMRDGILHVPWTQP